MAEDVCRSCGKPLAARAGRTGRSSVHCSAACRQRAYRERQAPAGVSVAGLIDDIGRPGPPPAGWPDAAPG
ncbi:hypothetical protein ABZT03_24245 [Streptomyces sp. NPDC005574]|uniref:hypothetical protein n=1 Tax=Streptomyces sp. NPDC005574 TaxID=3156891 RepID=UPI0033AEA815